MVGPAERFDRADAELGQRSDCVVWGEPLYAHYLRETQDRRHPACPEGITRSTVLRLRQANSAPFEERDLSLVDAYRADEAF